MPVSWSTTRIRVVAVAAALITVAGIAVAVTRESESGCDVMRDRVAAIEKLYGFEAAQSWEDILVLQESSTIAQAYRDAEEREQLLSDLAAEGCT